MTVIEERLIELDTLHLDKGNHNNFEEGHCAMEVVAWLAGEGITDAPVCASPVLRVFTVDLNDRWPDRQRQKLRPYLPRMVGTAGDGQDEARSYLALDWLIRTFTPAWLDLAGLTAEAAELRALRRIVDPASAEAAGPVVVAAWAAARAARDAAGAAARAARDAAGDAARAAAWDARVAAWDAAGAAWDARVAAWDAAGAAWDAAGAAAGDAARAARAARAALQPTVETLQESALELLDRMINPKGADS
jgi:hypothetical protein